MIRAEKGTAARPLLGKVQQLLATLRGKVLLHIGDDMDVFGSVEREHGSVVVVELLFCERTAIARTSTSRRRNLIVEHL